MNIKKVKILFIHHGNSQAGAARSLSFLIEQLDKDNYEPYVLCCKDCEKNKVLFESVGAKFLYDEEIGAWHGSTVSGMDKWTFQSNLTHVKPTLHRVPDYVQQINPDVIHLNSTCLAFAAKGIREAKCNTPIVCHVREPLLDGLWGDILREVNEKYVDRYIAIDQFDCNSLRTKLPIEVVYNFVDFHTYNREVNSDCLRQELGIPKNHFNMLYLARICPQNGALELVKHLQPLLNRRRDMHLCIVGDADYRTEYSIAVKEACAEIENAYVLPFRSDVPQVIASSDVMLVPFQQPHFARSVIEASAMGVPSIGSNIGGISEVIVDGETGLLFDYQTFSQLEAQCVQLADDAELRNRLGTNAYAFARETFDAVKNTRRICDIYQKLLAGRNI